MYIQITCLGFLFYPFNKLISEGSFQKLTFTTNLGNVHMYINHDDSSKTRHPNKQLFYSLNTPRNKFKSIHFEQRAVKFRKQIVNNTEIRTPCSLIFNKRCSNRIKNSPTSIKRIKSYKVSKTVIIHVSS